MLSAAPARPLRPRGPRIRVRKGRETGKLFGTDGIRGAAGRYPVDEQTAYEVGMAIVDLFARGDKPPRILIGRDTRESGPSLEAALAAGVAAAGGTVGLLGVLPTAGVAFVTRTSDADAGVVISASHNPFQDNGMKVFSGSGFKLSDEEEAHIEDLVIGDKAVPAAVSSRGSDTGGARTKAATDSDASLGYERFLKEALPGSMSCEGMKVVLDTANGATFRVAPVVFTALGADVTVINDDPDGVNINEGCGSEHTEGLRSLVRKVGADIGLAFDGDGDRLMAVDERGEELTGDQTLIICAKMLKDEGRLAGDRIVSTVMSNIGLSAACKRMGIENYAADVGDRHVMEQMQRLGVVLGGEPSGHVVFLDRHTTGDGILTGVQLIAAMLKAGKRLSEMADLMDVFPQSLVNVEISSKPVLESVPEIGEAVKAVESELGEDGRVLVRYSGTQPMCRVMVEGPTAETTERHAAYLAEVVKRALG